MELKLSIDMRSQVNKKALMDAIYNKWNKTLTVIAPSLSKELPRLLINGGGESFQAFTSTSLWRYLNTSKAWGELGFSDLRPLDDLMLALDKSMLITASKSKPKTLDLKLVNIEIVGKLTPHPSAGDGQLPAGLSWFVDWVVKGIPVGDYRFKRGAGSTARSSSLAGDDAGIMVPQGIWFFPPRFRMEVDNWLTNNLSAINKFMIKKIKKTIGQV